jgi:hypothetical protein
VPYEGPQIRDYGTVAELTAAHQLFSGMPGPSVSLLAFSGHSTPVTTPSSPTPTTQVAPSATTATAPSAATPTSGTSPLDAVLPGGGPSGGGPVGGAAAAHSVPGGAGKLPYTGLNVIGESLLGAGAVVTGFVARRFGRKPPSSPSE